ncbi:hypothetical protein N8586_03290 [Verrucomicrobiales bacterium]|nr:hypothetical protein [Verrucomicrobiales bacterium]
MATENIDKSLQPLYGDEMLAVQDRKEELAYLEYRLKTQALRENRATDELIREALAAYLDNPSSASAAKASFRRLISNPPLSRSIAVVAACLSEEYYAQRVIQF